MLQLAVEMLYHLLHKIIDQLDNNNRFQLQNYSALSYIYIYIYEILKCSVLMYFL